jgi:hypothetical protein
MIRIVTTTPIARMPPKTAANGASVPVAAGGGCTREGDVGASGVVAEVEAAAGVGVAAGKAARFSPHSTQKRAPVTIGAPHWGQKRTVTSEDGHFRSRASGRGY